MELMPHWTAEPSVIPRMPSTSTIANAILHKCYSMDFYHIQHLSIYVSMHNKIFITYQVVPSEMVALRYMYERTCVCAWLEMHFYTYRLPSSSSHSHIHTNVIDFPHRLAEVTTRSLFSLFLSSLPYK